MRALGHTVHTLASVWGHHRAELLPDEEWIAAASTHGWLVLSADKRVRYLPAFHANPVAVFALPRGNLPGDEQVGRFAGHVDRILAVAEYTPRPFLAVVYAGGVEVVTD